MTLDNNSHALATPLNWVLQVSFPMLSQKGIKKYSFAPGERVTVLMQQHLEWLLPEVEYRENHDKIDQSI